MFNLDENETALLVEAVKKIFAKKSDIDSSAKYLSNKFLITDVNIKRDIDPKLYDEKNIAELLSVICDFVKTYNLMKTNPFEYNNQLNKAHNISKAVEGVDYVTPLKNRTSRPEKNTFRGVSAVGGSTTYKQKSVYGRNVKNYSDLDFTKQNYTNLYTDENSEVCDLNNKDDNYLAYTKPVQLTYKGKILLSGVTNWSNACPILCAFILNENETKIGQSRYDKDTCSVFFNDDNFDLIRCPAYIGYGEYIELNRSAAELMLMAKLVLLWAHIPLSDVEVRFVRDNAQDNAEKREKEPSATELPTKDEEQKDKINVDKALEYLAGLNTHGATVSDIIANAMPSAPRSRLENALKQNGDVIQYLPENRHAFALSSSFVDLDEAKTAMRAILKRHFASFYGYSNHVLLYEAAKNEMFMFLNDNDCDNDPDVFSLCKYFFGKEYIFTDQHIFEREPVSPNLHGYLINVARSGGGLISGGDAKACLERVRLYVDFPYILDIKNNNSDFLYYDEDNYILCEALFDDNEFLQGVTSAVNSLLSTINTPYIPLRNITRLWLDTLPKLKCGKAWTALLFQEVVRRFDVGFRLIGTTKQKLYKLCPAIVPVDSNINRLSDVVYLYLKEKYVLPKKMQYNEIFDDMVSGGIIDNDRYELNKEIVDSRFVWSVDNSFVTIR